MLIKEKEMDEPRVYAESFWNAGEKKMLVAWLYENASAGDAEATPFARLKTPSVPVLVVMVRPYIEHHLM